MAVLPPLGETLRRRRLERGLSLDDAASELGIPARDLRALEWDRRDLLSDEGDAERIEQAYAALLGLDAVPVPPSAEADEPAPAPSEPGPDDWMERLGRQLALLALGIAVAVGVFALLSWLT
jgi:cytoskeletal protein RodZ